MARTKHRGIVSQHLHSTFLPQEDDLPEEYELPRNQAGFDINDLARMLRTPSSEPGFKEDHDMEHSDREESEEPKYSAQKPLHPYQIQGSFENTCKNECSTLSRHLKAFIHTSSKANDITADQRFPMLWDLRERKLKELEDMGKLTMRTHRDRVAKGWTTLGDEIWVKKQFSGYVHGRAAGTSFFTPTATASRSERPVQKKDYYESSDEEDEVDDEDQDDEELDAPGIKKEHLDNDGVAIPRIGATATQNGLGYPAHLKPIEDKAVARNFCCRVMLNQANGKPAMEVMEGVQRTWKWIDGKMWVRPAFATEQKSRATEAVARRADSVVGEENKVKQQADEEVEASSSGAGAKEAGIEGVQGIKRPAEEGAAGDESAAKKIKIEA